MSSDDWGSNDYGASAAIQRGILKETSNELFAAETKIEKLQARVEELEEKEELAWGLIANAWDYVQRTPGKGSQDWIEAAEDWRDSYPSGPEIVHPEFHCPDCNGTHFGTSNMQDDEEWIVHCHGDDDRDTCGWSGLHRDHVPGSGRGEIE